MLFQARSEEGVEARVGSVDFDEHRAGLPFNTKSEEDTILSDCKTCEKRESCGVGISILWEGSEESRHA